MAVTVVVGGFFGDEGKGKIVAFHALTSKPQIAVRGGVGPNAGHTVVHNGVTHKTRLVPSGFINPTTKLMIGPGVLVDEKVFLHEVDDLGVTDRIWVDHKCGLIEASHIERDRGNTYLSKKIETTGTGTGPAMEERVARTLRLCASSEALKPFASDTVSTIHDALDKGHGVLAEGTQGTFLSLYHGTYPYVTSKDVTSSSVCADIGVGPKDVEEVIAVFKSYVTRVGKGPLKNELSVEEIKKRGWLERGSVTGRLRRAAPFDTELAAKSVRLNGATSCAITKLDALFPAAAGVRHYDRLTREAKQFIEQLENELKVPVRYVGTGAEVIDTIIVPH
jgi:adenylosuccinate synthase